MFVKTCILLTFLTVTINAIGYQHGTFRSQSTQGASWTGTATITSETYNITVHRDYLDVELELIFKAGGTAPQQYTDALEIVGNISMEQGSIIIGMLTWYNDKILKAKLQRKDLARKKYEEVVERNSDIPPPPRDPVFLEYGFREDNYDISIFPITWGEPRKVRMRYIVPSRTLVTGSRFGYPSAFTRSALAIIRKGSDIDGFSLDDPQGNVLLQTDDSLTITGDTAYTRGKFLTAAIPSEEAVNTPFTNTRISSIPFNIGDVSGELSTISNFSVGIFLDSLKNILQDIQPEKSSNNLSIFAVFSNGAETCSTGVHTSSFFIDQLEDDTTAWMNNCHIFSKNPMHKEIVWHAYLNNTLIAERRETAVTVQPYDPSIAGCIAAASKSLLALDTKLPNSLGAFFGFVDSSYSLLALEEDALPDSLKTVYDASGVPTLNKEDIFADPADMVFERTGNLYYENAFNTTGLVTKRSNDAATDLFSGLQLKLKQGLLAITLSNSFNLQNRTIAISIYTLSGKLIKKVVVRISDGSRNLQISLDNNYPQMAIVCINAGGIKTTRKVQLTGLN